MDIAASAVARAEARAFARQAVALERDLLPVRQESAGGVQMAFMVLSALAVELYFKSFTILARRGNVTTGTDLSALYLALPDFLKGSFEADYARLTACGATGSTMNPDQPLNDIAGPPPASFGDALLYLTRSFGVFRDNADREGLKNLAFRCRDAVAVIDTLEATSGRFERGEFAAHVKDTKGI